MASDWRTYLEQHSARFERELFDLLRIPSISTEPEHNADVRRAVEWTAHRMESAGLEGVRILETKGHPVAYAEWLHAPDKPTVLIYGHVDVQPVDPIDLWTSPPFEPTVRDGKVYARGSSDMKAQVMLAIAACEALLKTTGRLPVNVKFYIEAEEEIGSPSAPSFLTTHRDLFACGLVINADSGQRSPTEPSLPLGTRGLGGVQIDVRAASTDMHSGGYGGAAPNPIHALVALLNSMRGPDGRILVRGFYDDVRPLSDSERKEVANAARDEAEVRSEIGARTLLSEPGYTAHESRTVRPTLELNGIWGGYQGPGVKTVIPAEAHAKITCRLVPDQDPDRIVKLIQDHVREHASPAVEASAKPLEAGAHPYRVRPDHPAVRASGEVLTELYGRPPVPSWSGGTVPVLGLFERVLRVRSIGMGFGLPGELVHAPNEHTRLDSYARGQRAYCMLLERLGRESAADLRAR